MAVVWNLLVFYWPTLYKPQKLGPLGGRDRLFFLFVVVCSNTGRCSTRPSLRIDTSDEPWWSDHRSGWCQHHRSNPQDDRNVEVGVVTFWTCLNSQPLNMRIFETRSLCYFFFFGQIHFYSRIYFRIIQFSIFHSILCL